MRHIPKLARQKHENRIYHDPITSVNSSAIGNFRRAKAIANIGVVCTNIKRPFGERYLRKWISISGGWYIRRVFSGVNFGSTCGMAADVGPERGLTGGFIQSASASDESRQIQPENGPASAAANSVWRLTRYRSKITGR